MGSPENFGTNNASSSNGGIMPLSLLESASLGAALDDNSALISLQKTLRTPSGSDPINSELASLKKSPNATEDNQSSQDSTNYTSPGSNIFGQEQLSNQPQSFINTSLFPSSNNKNSNKAKDKDSLTGNAKDTSLIGITEQNSLTTGALGIEQSQQNSSPSTAKTNSSASTTNQTTIPNFAIRTEGTISINGSSDFDGVPTDLSDDALIYAAKGFTINGNPTLPVQRDAQGNPIRDASGKLILVDKAVAVAAGYTVTNGPSNQYAGLNPPTVVPQQTVTVPAYADIKQLELAKRIPNGTPTVTFNISQNPINNANDWSKKFPPPGTASNPTVVRVTGGGLNIPANVTLNNYVITVEQGDINFNGNGHNFNNVVLVANNGNINLSNVQARDLSVFASGSINMNGGARFAGSSLLANGSNNGNITFNGATSSTNTNDNLKVISQGDITYNGASNTRGLFLSVKNFTFNGSSTLYGSISAKGNIIFNGKATVIAVAELMPDITAPIITATLARDTAPLGQTNTDKITFDPTIAGTVIDASPILEFRAGFNNTPPTNYTNVIAQRNSDGSFSFTRAQLETIYGSTLLDGIYTLHLQAKDLYGNLSNSFDVTFTLDTTTPDPSNLDLSAIDDSGANNTDNITNKKLPAITGNAEAGAVVQLFNQGQILGQSTANNAGTWQIVTSDLTDGTYNLTASSTDIAGNVSTASNPLQVVIDTVAPNAPTNLKLTTASDTGVSNSDNITKNATPTIQGSAEAGTIVRLFKDGQLVGQTTASVNGAWQLQVGPLTDGQHIFTASSEDKAGNVSVSSNQLTVTVDTQIAPPSNLDLLAASDRGSSDNDNITNDTTPTIAGHADANSLVQLFNDGQLVGQTTTAANGEWQLTTNSLTDGVHNFTAIATDSAGNFSSPSAPLAVTLDSALPLLTLNTPLETTPLIPNARFIGSIDGTGSAVTALSYRFNNLAAVAVAFNATGGFDQAFDLTGLNNGSHILTITTTDKAGNVKTNQYNVTVILDREAPVISARLTRDTAPGGITNSDTITFDPTFAGTVIDASRVVDFRAGFDSTLMADFTNVTALRNADGSFSFDRTQLATIYGNTLPDGIHTLHLQAVDEFGNTSNVFDISFILDTITPEPVFNLDAVSDSGVAGDRQTKFDTVTLVGQSEAYATVVLEQIGAVTTSDHNGQFSFTNVQLAIGNNSLTARATDIAGNENTFSTNIYRFSPPTAINLTGNIVAENSISGTVIGQLSSTDPDAGDSHTYTLEDDAGGRFRIVGNQLQVADGTLLNFESSTQHSITVKSTDTNGLSNSFKLTIGVTNVNEAPSFTSTPISTVDLGSLYRYNIVTSDPDAADTRRIIADNLPSWLTLVDNLDGTATLSGTSTNFLDNTNINLKVTDAGGLTAIQEFTITSSNALVEGTNFTASRSFPVTIGATPSILSFKIDKSFDTTDIDAINDALEVALIDANGKSLVHTIASGRDAFFNWTEGESALLGAGASYDAASRTVSLNLTGITPTNAQLVFRLVNNDSDTTSSVRITDFAITAAPTGTQPPVQSDFGTQTSLNTGNVLLFNLLADISQSFVAEYHRTSLNADSRLLYADIAIRNIGSYSIDAPLIVAVNHISNPSVLVRNSDGFTPEGVPYYDFSKLVGDSKLDPQELTQQRSLIFYNPNSVQFTYDLSVLAQLNAAPVIQTQANKEIITGHSYSYDVDATDPNGDSLTYKLLVSPQGMTIDSTSGLISWNTTSNNIGNYAVEVEVSDSHGGITKQQYTLAVISPPPNRPPLFTSIPVVNAAINTNYTYQAKAIDPDDNPLTFSLASAPEGMSVNPNTGVITWKPNGNQLGLLQVILNVTDGFGGTTQQRFQIQTQIEPGNHAPIITSTAPTTAYTATGYTYQIQALDADQDTLTYALDTAPAGMTIDATTGQILWTTKSNNAGTYNIAVKVLDKRGGVDTQNFTLNLSSNLPGQIWGRVFADGSNLQLGSYSSQSQPRPRTGNRLAAQPIPLTSVLNLPNGFYSASGMEYYEPAEQILISDTGSTRTTSRLNLIQPDGTLVPFSNVTQDVGPSSSGIAITALRYFTTVPQDNLGGFTPGDIFGNAGFRYSSFGYDPYITKITDGGATIIPQWAALPANLTYREISFQIDTTGIFGGDLIVQGSTSVDSRGYDLSKSTLFRVKADGTVSRLATLDNDYGGNTSFEIVPNDSARYGPLAGKIIVAHNGAFSTVDVAGNVQYIPLQGSGSIRLIRPNENLFAGSYSYNPQTLLSIPASNFQPMVGDFLIGGDGGLLRRMYWDGQAIKIEILNGRQLAGMTFAPVGINNIASVSPVSLADWTVYVDKNNNGRRDSDELSTTTDTNGIYSFTLPVGNYTIAQELPGGWSQIKPASNQPIQVTLSSGQTITGVDFGNIKSDPAPQENQAPLFTSFAPTQAIANQRVVYKAVASDPDGDVLSYDLVVKPDGMVIDSNTGIVAWRPTSEQVGTQNVIVRVRDAQGALDLQSFQVQVGSSQTPPLFTALPKSGSVAAVGVPFQFQIQARNPALDPITFELTTDAPGVVLDSSTGLFKWTPTVEKTYNFTITANDGKGAKTTKSFQLQALKNVPNDAPIITSQPPSQITPLGLPYVYTVQASDPNNDPLTYTLVTAPQGMTLDKLGNLFWQPQANQLRLNSIAIKVSDGRGGEATQSFNVNVASSATIANHVPSITSTPVQSAVVNKVYQYELKFSDLDNDFLLLNLKQAPQGMFLDPATGILRWIPTEAQLGENTVVVQVQDSHGAFDLQEFKVNVRLVNTPPAINSNPPTVASAGKLYKYQVQATDVDSDSLAYSLVNAPSGMTIDAKTGLIQWTPTNTQLGRQDIIVAVNDGQGGSANQSYSLLVSDTAVNNAPAITSVPITVAAVDRPYQYQVVAFDPEGQSLQFALENAPSGMTIDATGLLQWHPTISQIGSYTIKILATDAAGAVAVQNYTLLLRANASPIINSHPSLIATLDTVYAYDVIASDVDGDRLTYTLDQASRNLGMTLDTLGRLRWTPTTSNVGSHHVVLSVSDGVALQQQEFDLVVASDTIAPKVSLIANYNQVNLGETVIFQARATDNIKVAGLQLLINNTPVVLDANGMARFTPNQAGTIIAKAIATDTAGNIGQVTFDVAVIDTSDVNAPEVSLDLGAYAGNLVTAPIDIKGSISDDGSLDYYRLLVAPVAGGEFKQILFVDNPNVIANGVLGKFDPSLLQNDSYILRLEVADNGGHISYAEEVVDVAGELKLGNFRLSFTDLSIPVTGIPITLTRTYDTLTSASTDDFGYGWRMEFRDTDLRTSLKRDAEMEELGYYTAFKEGTRVYITLPGGKREAFTFKPKMVEQYDGVYLGQFAKYFYQPEFVADKGVTSTLTVESNFITKGQGTDQFYGFAGNAYNPEDPYFGGKYKLTTKEGVVYEIDAVTGDLLTVTDTNGNKLTYTDAGIYSSTGKQITFERDAQGRIASVKDPMGELIRYTYDANGDLVSVTDRENNTTRMEYKTERSHYLDKIIDPLNRTGIRNEYGDDGRLKEIVDVKGQKVEMSYDQNNSRQTVLDQLGHATIYEYDARGNILTEIDAEGQITKRKYDDDNNILEETVISDRSGPDGFTTKYTYDNKNNKLTQEDALGNITRYTYGAYSRLLTETDALGRTTTNAYDSYGNLSATKDAVGKVTSYGYDGNGQLTSFVDANKQATRFDYDSNGNVTQVTDALGNVTKYTYNRNGDKLTETRYMTLANGQVRELLTKWTYDDNGRVKTMTDAENHTTSYEYDANGKQIAVIDALQHRTEYKYNERGELVETIYADETPDNPFGNLRDISRYDAAGRTIATIDKAGRETRFVYDDVGRLIKTILPDNTPNNWDDNPKTRTDYYSDGLVKAEIDERSNRTEFRYDAVGRLLEIIYADNTPNTLDDNPRTTYKYDKAGQRIAETDALNHTTTYKYDDLGRLIETEFNDKTYTTSEYDNLGRRIAMTEQNDKRTEYRYDALGRLTGVKNALQDWTEYGYNEVGNLIWMEDANDHRTKYEYDSVGRRTAVILPMDQRSDSVYDAVGNLKTYTDFNRNTTTYQYDPMNWITSKQFQDGSKVTYAYTAVGLQDVITFVDANGVTTAIYDYDYDERDRLVKRTDNIGGVSRNISYTYDAASNRTSVTTASGTVNYTFDVRNRLDQVIEDGVVTTDYDYDVVSNLVRTTFVNGTQEIRQYDDLNRLKYLENRKGDSVLSSYTYTLDKVGNRTKVVEHDGRTVDYTYDDLYRLTQEKITDSVNGNRIYEYNYDKVGNRTAKNETVNGTTKVTNYGYDANDRLLNETVNQQVVVNYTYDNNGNTLTKTENGITTEYSWDYENRLIAARFKDADDITQQSMQYQYNDNGIRVSSTVNGVETRYLIDEVQPYAQVLEEYSPNGAVQVEYFYGNDLIAQGQDNSRTYYHVDGLGSTRVLTDLSGSVVHTYDYEAYGELISSTGGVENKYLFAGEQFDEVLGDYYNRARYYDADTGRFIKKDDYEGQISEPLTLHKYLYTHNNPSNFIDPTGLFTVAEISAADSIRNILSSIQIDLGANLIGNIIGNNEPISDDYYILVNSGGLDLNERVVNYLENYTTRDYAIRFLIYGGALPIPKRLIGVPVLPGSSKLTNPISIIGLHPAVRRRLRLPRRILGTTNAVRALGRANVILATGLLIYDAALFAKNLINDD
ncbi:putative Ig domain-containing protein [Nostoc sp. 106C]|uniref:putative Ig domain-containing protein n=1 Tax=Nostoc sp. 106C TaxID=1932667 RepID=UPI000A36F1C3|nr:putative Ig domain-containing protein [Nostoc sp. 106C]OUL33998.1 hypothetical protein BV375_05560 [Nostoc sp. 106C]